MKSLGRHLGTIAISLVLVLLLLMIWNSLSQRAHAATVQLSSDASLQYVDFLELPGVPTEPHSQPVGSVFLVDHGQESPDTGIFILTLDGRRLRVAWPNVNDRFRVRRGLFQGTTHTVSASSSVERIDRLVNGLLLLKS